MQNYYKIEDKLSKCNVGKNKTKKLETKNKLNP